MADLEIIDAEFTVISPGRLLIEQDGDLKPVTVAPWSFWRDDVPNLVGYAGGLAALIAVRWLFHR